MNLIGIRIQAVGMQTAINNLLHASPQNLNHQVLVDLYANSIRMVSAIDELIVAPPTTSAEFEQQAKNTAPLAGETVTGTENRLAAERAANPLLPHQVQNPQQPKAK